MDRFSDIPKIRVCVRKRPLNKKELAANEKDNIEIREPSEIFVRETK
jgi:hypothetical protein